jgi:hypothetical protein
MDADGTKLNGLTILASMKHRRTHEVVPDPCPSSHVEIDFTGVEITEPRGHILVMHQQRALLLRQGLRLHKGDSRAHTADAVKEDQRSQDILILPRRFIGYCRSGG